MSSTASLEASDIRRRGRRRLIGAIALVMLLVVFVPMILDSEPRPARHAPALEIPSRDNAPPLPEPAPPTRAPPTPAPAAPAPPVGAKPQAEAPKAALVEPVVAPAPAADPPLTGFAVQVGAFRDEARLEEAREKLAAAGVVHYTERLETSSGPLTRLRAGPFATREAAEGALARLKRAAVEGNVVSLQ